MMENNKIENESVHLPNQQPKSTVIDFGKHTKESNVPDGGYGWVVLIVALAIRIVCGGLLVTYGSLMNPLISEYQTSHSTMSWLASLMSAMNLACAPIGGLISSKLSNRVVVIFGLILAGIVFAAPYFYSSLWFLFLSSILTGIGIGIAMFCTTLVLTSYFNERLSLVLRIFTSGNGITSLVVTPIFGKLIHWYGWRLSMLIYGSLFVSCAIFALLLKPISCKVLSSTPITDQSKDKTDNIDNNDVENNVSEETCEKKDVNNCESNGLLRLLRNRMLLIFLIGNFLAKLGHDTTFIFAKVRAMNSGIEEWKACFLMLSIGIGSTSGRLIFGYLASKKCVKAYILYCASLILSGGFLLFSSIAYTYPLMLVYTIGFSLFIGSYVTLTPVVLLKIVDLNDFNRGLGLTHLTQAFGLLICSPLSGLIYDLTKTLEWSFIVSGILILVGGLILLLAYCSKKFRES